MHAGGPHVDGAHVDEHVDGAHVDGHGDVLVDAMCAYLTRKRT